MEFRCLKFGSLHTFATGRSGKLSVKDGAQRLSYAVKTSEHNCASSNSFDDKHLADPPTASYLTTRNGQVCVPRGLSGRLPISSMSRISP